jgi:hypothetical protein
MRTNKRNPSQTVKRDSSGQFRGSIGIPHGAKPVSFKLPPVLREALIAKAAAENQLHGPYLRAIVLLMLELQVPSVAWLREAILEKQEREQT